MAEILERYYDDIAGKTTVYACDGCGKPTKRRKSLPNRVVLCCDCQKAKAKAQEKARRDAIYHQGYADAIDKIIEYVKCEFIKQNNPYNKFVPTIVINMGFIETLEQLKEKE